MRRPRRHKYFQLTISFLVIHAVSVANSTEIVENPKVPTNSSIEQKNKTDTQKHGIGSHASKHLLHALGNATQHVTNATEHHHAVSQHVHQLIQNSTNGSQNKNTTTGHGIGGHAAKHLLHAVGNITNINPNITEHHHEVPKHIEQIIKNSNKSIISKNVTEQFEQEMGASRNICTPAAVKQFPRPLLGQEARVHGGIVIHIIVAVYMFLGLAIVCDEYFVASLDRICEELKMSPDVAGATFMAAGSSAPELATVVIGVFFAQDDIGISGVIGSAVFNIMFVISCCGLCSTAVVYLNWWPLIRDCFFYAVSILVMLVVIYNEEISWMETIVMLLTYVVYCIVLHFNTPLERWAQTWPVPFKQRPLTEQSGLVSYKTLEESGKKPSYGMEFTSEKEQQQQQQQHQPQWSPDKQQQQWSPEKQQQGNTESINFGMDWSPEKHQESFANQLSGPALNQATTTPSSTQPATIVAATRPNQQEYYRPKEYDPNAQINPLTKPEGAGIFKLICWGTVFPIHWLCRYTMPDCRAQKYRNWYPFTFFMSMLWISFYSYFMVWMITIIGYTMGIPDTVMGLTFVAAGVSVPDALSSVAVIKEGYGDMAVSNAVGSNVFDILICLGLPWFLKTAIINPGSTVRVISKGLTYSTLSLLSTVVFLVMATHWNGWKLDRRYGIVLMVWYLIFITFASMYELNLFGEMNPKVCEIHDGW